MGKKQKENGDYVDKQLLRKTKKIERIQRYGVSIETTIKCHCHFQTIRIIVIFPR